MTTSLIRNEVNYGPLCVYVLEGIRFLADPRFGELAHYADLEIQEIPEFEAGPVLKVALIPSNTMYEAYVYVFDKKDIRPLAEALSVRHRCSVSVSIFARILARWENGEKKSERKLEDFYSGLSAEDIEKATF